MPTYRLTIAYDGTDFRGFAANPGVRTVQAELEAALTKVAREEVSVVVAGRTDAGVHARANVVSFDAGASLEPAKLRRAITSMLGPEIVAIDAAVAPDGFNARFSATHRRYRYRIETGDTPDPLRRRVAWHVPYDLDVDAMNRAAAAYVGEHDFASLCRAAEGKTTERTVLEAGWAEDEAGLVFDVTALAFCHQMVRSMVALCVEVGRGRVPADAVPGILEACDRNAARGAAPPHGLVLWEVGYDEGAPAGAP